MVAFNLDQTARARLAATKGVSILPDALPHHPEIITILAGIRVLRIVSEGDAYSAACHLRYGTWLALADGVSEDAAFAAILAFVPLVASVPQFYAPEHDAA